MSLKKKIVLKYEIKKNKRIFNLYACAPLREKSVLLGLANLYLCNSPRPPKNMTQKKYSWQKVANHINELTFADNNMTVAEVKGKKMCLAKFKDQVFAVAYTCPHAGGIMANGYLDALGNVVCPLHRYKYCLGNGRNVSGEGYYLKHWPVEVREDGVYVGMEESSGWNIFR